MTINLKRTVNLSEPVLPEVLSAPLYQDEKNAHTFVIEATKNEVPLTLEGSVTAYFVRGDGNTVQLEGDIVNAMAKVTLSKSCYYTGAFRMAVMLITQETRTVIYAASGRVKGIKDGEIIDGGENEENGTPGAVGKDGATFFPYVDENGNLSWTNDKDLPNPPTVNIEGPPGPAGQDGKTAYQYARDGGYTGSEAEFASKMAKEIPEPYTLPVASADTLGGVKVGDGLEVVDGKLNAFYRKVELINSFIVTEDVDSLAIDKDVDGNPFELKVAIMRIQCGMDVAEGEATGSIMFSTPTNSYFARIHLNKWKYPGYKVTDTYTRPSTAAALCDVSRDLTFLDGIYGDEGGAVTDRYSFSKDSLAYAPDTVIVRAGTNFKVPKNAKVWLYGVRRIGV